MGHSLLDVKRLRSKRVLMPIIAIALPALGAVCWLLWFSADAGAQKSSEATIEQIDATQLAGAGISLEAVSDDYTPLVSAEQAAEAAADLPGVSVRDTFLAYASWGGFSGEVWVVILDPGTFRPPNHAGQIHFVIGFVDPETGKHIQTVIS